MVLALGPEYLSSGWTSLRSTMILLVSTEYTRRSRFAQQTECHPSQFEQH